MRRGRERYLILVSPRRLEIFEYQNEYEEVVHAEALLQDVAGEEFRPLFFPEKVPDTRAKRNGGTHKKENQLSANLQFHFFLHIVCNLGLIPKVQVRLLGSSLPILCIF